MIFLPNCIYSYPLEVLDQDGITGGWWIFLGITSTFLLLSLYQRLGDEAGGGRRDQIIKQPAAIVRDEPSAVIGGKCDEFCHADVIIIEGIF